MALIAASTAGLASPPKLPTPRLESCIRARRNSL
jgi:hypothetical protein